MTAVPVLAAGWCGRCDERTRLLELDDGRAARCPDCHPLSVERWRSVVGYEGLYEVSDLGRVRSKYRGGRILVPQLTGRYLSVKLCRDGKVTTRRVHRLVAEAFLGPLPPGQHTRHGPGGRLDNRLVNLSYGTPLQNSHDQERDGTRRRGDAKQEAKLTAEIVTVCRVRFAAGETGRALAAEYEVSVPTMQKAITGRTWQTAGGPIADKTALTCGACGAAFTAASARARYCSRRCRPSYSHRHNQPAHCAAQPTVESP